MSYKTCFREPSNNDKYIYIYICFFLQDRNEIPWELNMRILANQKNITPKIADTSHGNSRRKKHKKNNPLGDKIPWVEGWCVIICLPSDFGMPGMPRLVPSLRQHAGQCPHMWGPYLSKPPQQQFHKRSEGIIKQPHWKAMYSFLHLWESKSKHNPYQTSNSNKAHQRKLIDPESQLPVYFSGIIVPKFKNRKCASESIIDLKMFVHFNACWIPTVGNLTESGTTPETRSSHVEFKQFVRTRMILPLVGLISMVSKSRVAVQDLKNFFLAFGLDGLEVLPVQETSCWKKGQ